MGSRLVSSKGERCIGSTALLFFLAGISAVVADKEASASTARCLRLAVAVAGSARVWELKEVEAGVDCDISDVLEPAGLV